ncbi:MAG: GNAT family protein [bacterium]
MPDIVLKNGETMQIRKVSPDDSEEILRYLKVVGGESDNLTFGSKGIAFTLDQEREFLTKLATMETTAIFCGVVNGAIIVLANINAPTNDRIAHTSEIGISVLKAYWGQGVASAVIRQLIDFAKATQVIKIIHLKVRADNVRAIHVYEKAGFQHIGRYAKQLCIDGEYFDTLMMNLYL